MARSAHLRIPRKEGRSDHRCVRPERAYAYLCLVSQCLGNPARHRLASVSPVSFSPSTSRAHPTQSDFHPLPRHSYALLFLVQPVGLFAEKAFLRLTGRKVGGLWGAIWTWSFLVYFGAPVVQRLFRIDAGAGMGCGSEGEPEMAYGTPVRSAVRWALRVLQDAK